MPRHRPSLLWPLWCGVAALACDGGQAPSPAPGKAPETTAATSSASPRAPATSATSTAGVRARGEGGTAAAPSNAPAASVGSPRNAPGTGAAAPLEGGPVDAGTLGRAAEAGTPDGNSGAKQGAEPDKPAPQPAPEKAAPEEKPGKYWGKKAVEPMYAAWLQSAGRYTVGKASSIQAVLVAKGAYHCNAEYPFKLKLDAAPPGVTFPAPIARAVSKGPKRTVVSIPFTPTTPGDKTVSGTFYLSVCNDTTCKIAKQRLSVKIVVHPE